MNMIDIIAKNARIYPQHTAFVEVRPVSRSRRSINWAQFDDRINRLAGSLIEKGVRKGDKIFIFGKNSINWLETYFAVMAAGAWAVPLNFRFDDESIKYCANAAHPVAFFMDAEFAPGISALRADLPTVKNFICIDAFEGMQNMEALIEKTPAGRPQITLKDDDACALYFTSGTTGEPKPVLHVHKNLMCVALNEATNERWEQTDCLLMLPPFYHLAIGHLLGCMLAGGRAILLTEKITPTYIFENISNERVSLVFLLVPWALDILQALDSGELKKQDYDLTQWRLLYMGAQPIPASLVQRWWDYFPGMQFDNSYGLSETTGPGTLHLGIGNETKIGAIGKPGLLWDARIVDDRGEDIPPGQVGEIIVKGAGLMQEYYKNPGLTAQSIRNGWLFTGDLGKCDEDGFIYFVDRKKDLVISGGENIYPVEVEAVIQRHPDVHDVAVIGTPDDRLGEIATAIIELIPDRVPSEEEMTAFCKQNLPRYKRPRRFIFDPVPRGPTGKIEKPRLRAKYCQPK
ncbi:MAG: AMP-binding protein [Desulfobacterales bacterium]|jgi:acyl-CoA synthetase (AMP-forming)/AMP-acid ligase II|nr:AMP-binding protein [Desulfobacterales bacterium]